MGLPDRTAVARQLGVTLEAPQWAALEHYVELLRRWNARFNLISRRDVDRIWSRHVLDSLSVLPLLRALPCRGDRCRALDVGSGAGFPGLPLAVADPEMDWLLVDRNGRKVRFLELVVAELRLGNVSVRNLDLVDAPPDDLLGWADCIVSRAVEAPVALVRRCAPMLTGDGSFVLLTGAAGASSRERAGAKPGGSRAADVALPAGFRLAAVRQLRIPGLDQLHEVTIIHRDGNVRAEQVP